MCEINLCLEKDYRFIELYKQKINILIYVANEIEFSTTRKFLIKNSKNNKIISFIEDDNQYYISKLGSYPIVLVKGGTIGQIHVSTCDEIISKALKSFHNINYLVTVGVCGAASNDVKIGDVIIANGVIDYESQKIKKDGIIDRSQGIYQKTLSSIISSKVSLMKYSEFKVHYGKILSGNKLINNKDYADDLLKIFPEAIALDMEGYAIARLAMTYKLKDWLFVKSASDKLYDKVGSANQEKSTNHALIVLKDIFDRKEIFNKSDKIKVMISGAYTNITEDSEIKNVEEFTYILTKRLIEKGYKVVNGYGQCIGNAVIAGAYNSLNGGQSINDVVEIYPFPRIKNPAIADFLDSIKYENRELMIKNCSFCIFIYGKKNSDNLSTGMMDEFRIANNNKAFLIPVGATEFMAKELWKKVNNEYNIYFPEKNKEIQNLFNDLNNSESSNDELINKILKIIELLSLI